MNKTILPKTESLSKLDFFGPQIFTTFPEQLVLALLIFNNYFQTPFINESVRAMKKNKVVRKQSQQLRNL